MIVSVNQHIAHKNTKRDNKATSVGFAGTPSEATRLALRSVVLPQTDEALSEMFSNQLRRLIQGLPINFDQGLPGQPLRDKSTVLPMPSMEAYWFKNEERLKSLFSLIGDKGQASLLPLLEMVKECDWHMTLYWLKPAEESTLLQLNFPTGWVQQLKQRMLPDVEGAIQKIKANTKQST